MGRSTAKYSSRDSGGEFLCSEVDLGSFEIIGQNMFQILRDSARRQGMDVFTGI